MSLAAATDKFCKVCGTLFHPVSTMHTVCSPPCGIKLGKGFSKQRRESTLREAKQTRERRAALKTIPDLIKEADRAFAAYIRLRDRLAGYACISSGKPLDWTGNKVDAGHYRSRGAASHLRYHRDNAHAQSKLDNQWKAGNVVEYRIRLIDRIGLERVEALERDNTPVKWTKEMLLEVIATFKREFKELEARQ